MILTGTAEDTERAEEVLRKLVEIAKSWRDCFFTACELFEQFV